jgi:peptidoglycan/xylan/chitin deacetylase (PgdA/CDA1 family)
MPSVIDKLLSPLRYTSGQYQRRWRQLAVERGITAVVCYHRIVPAGARSSDDFAAETGVPVDVFKRQMEFLARHFRAVMPSEASHREPGQVRCAITFDDGYLDNHTLAAPVLKSLGLPAGFYVCIDYVGTERWFWWETVAELFRRTVHGRFDAGLMLPQQVADGRLRPSYPLVDFTSRHVAGEHVMAVLRNAPQSAVDAALKRLSEVLDVALPAIRRRAPLMDTSHLKDLRRHGFEIGAHSANHVNLAQADEATLQREVVLAHRQLESASDGPIRSFAYPYGREEHLSRSAAELLRRLGYDCAYTTVKGVADGSHDRYFTPRIHLNPRWAFGCAYNIDDALKHPRQAAPPVGGLPGTV